MTKKIFKKVLEAFGGAALYLDKAILKALDIQPRDEVMIEIQEGKVIITKPAIDSNKIKELLDANEQFRARI
jgi:antitoxin component of MazEF toxin-antitoxin module